MPQFYQILRWLIQRLRGNFEKTGLDFQVDYVTSVRNWTDSIAKFSTLSGAYRKRNIRDVLEIPHSFTFARRDSTSHRTNNSFDPAIEYGLKTLNALTAHGTPKVCPNIYWHKLQTECLPDLVVSLATMCFFWSRPLFLSLSYAKIRWWYGQGPKLIQLQSTYVALLQTKCQDEGVMSISLFRSPRSNHVFFW